jgi:hypothetical protein
MKTRLKRLLFISALVLTVVVAVWAVSSLRDDDSSLSVFVRNAGKRMGWSADTTTYDVILRMSGYINQGRYDDAVRVGNAWTARNPNSESNVELYRLISQLYLERAKADSGHADDYVRQAMLYRDKMLPFESNNIYGLRYLESLSEAGGDLSESQRCVQYRNAMKLLEHLTNMLREQRTVAPKEKAFAVPRKGTAAEYVLTVEDIDAMMERARRAVAQVQEKLQKSGCE